MNSSGWPFLSRNPFYPDQQRTGSFSSGKGNTEATDRADPRVNYTSKLVSVQENTDYLNIDGFVGKPDTAKRTPR